MNNSLRPEPCVDVIIAAWNAAETIGRAIASALAEPEVLSVIVVDDGSADETFSRAQDMAAGNGRVVVLRLPRNGGPAAARNAALQLSMAPWITMLDSDDYFLPGRMSRLLKAAPGWDFIADDILQIDEVRIGSDEPAPMLGADGPLKPWQCNLETFVLGNIGKKGRLRKELGFLKPLVRRAFLDACGLSYDDALRLGEDYALYARALAAGARFRVIQSCGYVAVVRRNSISGAHSRKDLERLRDFDLLLQALPDVSASERRSIEKHRRAVDARAQWLVVVEAVRTRRIGQFLIAYTRSPEAARLISSRLLEQINLRSARFFISFFRRTLTRRGDGNRRRPAHMI
jgi:succinoglycan biosynthesis protein ExoU